MEVKIMDLDPPDGLKIKGARMWADSVSGWQLSPGHLVLLEEACRIADRLDTLDRLFDSTAANFGQIGPILAEARQQSNALKSILAELRQIPRDTGDQPKTGGAGVADLTARIAKRRQQPPA